MASRGRKDDRTQADASGHPYLAKLCDLVPTNERLLVALGKRFLGAIEPEELAGAEVAAATEQVTQVDRETENATLDAVQQAQGRSLDRKAPDTRTSLAGAA